MMKTCVTIMGLIGNPVLGSGGLSQDIGNEAGTILPLLLFCLSIHFVNGLPMCDV